MQKGVKIAELSYDEFKPWKIRVNLPSKIDYEIRRRGTDRKVEIWTRDIAAADLIDKAVKKSLKGGE